MVKIRHPQTDLREGSETFGQGIDGTLELALEDPGGAPTGEIFRIPIVKGVMEVPDEHVAHVLAGCRGSRPLTAEEAASHG